MGKGENAGFSKVRLTGVVKSRDCVVKSLRTTILDLMKMAESSPYPFPKQALVFKCMQDKPFENTKGKGEIARNEQFLLFPQCFLSI